ncbi:hypothetical protein GCM10011390_42370 [Aureimonas endophytica]|uniref:Uncharacterized protein n=1 Tax=Aureimonas endophytica TaxID=2027858 RepID=A0A916ZY26_9HYPH|nr:hypothetical protein [Aureimonas endophytica]GGE18716.1 hypothetical protein GCM10011390_42370 [Aureimonas endophytica]
MSKNVIQFRSKHQREKEVDLLAKYREIGIAAIAAANQSFRKEKVTVEKRRVVHHHD